MSEQTTALYEGDWVTCEGRHFRVVRFLCEGQMTDVFVLREEGVPDRLYTLKVAAYPENDEFVLREVNNLLLLNQGLIQASKGIKLMFPELLGACEVNGRSAILTDFAVDYWTLEHVLREYPEGVRPEHVAWMFNRMVMALIECQNQGFVHGNILPCNVLIRSGHEGDDLRHTCVLVDWTCAVTVVSPGVWPKISMIDTAYQGFYPQEVLRGESSSPRTDLAMAANCAVYLLGGDPSVQTLPDGLAPWGMVQKLQACRHPNPAQRPRDLVTFYKEFQAALVPYFGPARFVELPLPRP